MNLSVAQTESCERILVALYCFSPSKTNRASRNPVLCSHLLRVDFHCALSQVPRAMRPTVPSWGVRCEVPWRGCFTTKVAVIDHTLRCETLLSSWSFWCSWLVCKHRAGPMCGWKRPRCLRGSEFVFVHYPMLIKATLYVFSVFPFQAHVFLEEAMLLTLPIPMGQGPCPAAQWGDGWAAAPSGSTSHPAASAEETNPWGFERDTRLQAESDPVLTVLT